MKQQRRTLLLLAVAAVGMTGCADAPAITPPATRVAAWGASRSLLSPALTLLICHPVPYDSVVQVVGPAGGTIRVGPDSLVIPAGALDTNTTITAVVPSDSLAVIRFQPHGLTFAQPAALALSYAACPLAGLLAPASVVYADDAWNILEIEPTSQHPLQTTVVGRIRHFSGYAVAY